MDDRRFDAFTRSLASGSSRRGLLTGIVIGAVSATLAAPRQLRGLAGGLTGREEPAATNRDLIQGCCGDADCDDRDLCTVDSCVDGICVHKPKDCDDGDPCTIDRCEGGKCFHFKKEGACCKDPAQECGDSCCGDNQFCCKGNGVFNCCTNGIHKCDLGACRTIPPQTQP